MSKLFIIGNGFDIASGLNTRYSDFRKWFISNYDLDYERLDRIVEEEAFSELEVPSSSIGRHGEVVYDESLAEFFYAIISYANDNDVLWSGFETNLSKLPFYGFEDCYYYDGEDEFEEAYIVEQVGNNLAHVFVDAVNEYFMNWIRHIYMTEQPINKKKLVCENKGSMFLTFNYTDVLEDFYDIRDDNICHIHGCIKGGGQIIVGHGEDDFHRREFDPLDINSYADDAKQTLRKPVKEIILKKRFF